jgi:hypothetical protein
MKKYLAALSTTALISVAPLALAASSTDLTVTGTITPSACTPSLSSGGIVDLGKIPVKNLNPTSHTLVNTTSMQLSVACESATTFALISKDNRPNTSFNNQGFGLGMTDADERLGAFAPLVRSVVADGVTARGIESLDNGATWIQAGYLSPDRITSVSAVGELVPMPAKDLVMNVQVQTWIARADSLTLTNDVTIDGSATFEMKYL